MTRQKSKKTVTSKKAAAKINPIRKALKTSRGAVTEETAAGEAAAETPTILAAVDERLPPPGTVIEKRDRHGKLRCKCTMLEGGKVRYNGHVYASISAAAMAAAKDLELENKTQNGYTFWGLSKPPRAASHGESADRAWERCSAHLKATLGKELTAEARIATAARLRGIGHQIETYLGQVA